MTILEERKASLKNRKYEIKCISLLYQGCKFSDYNLVSDLFTSTP